MTISRIVIDPNDNISVETDNGITIEGDAADKIYNHFFKNDLQEQPVNAPIQPTETVEPQISTQQTNTTGQQVKSSTQPQNASEQKSNLDTKNAIDKVVWSVKEQKYIPITQLSKEEQADLDKTRNDIQDYRSNIVTKQNNISDNSNEGKLSRQIGTKLESYTRMVSPEGKTEFFKEAYQDMMKKGNTEFKAHGIMHDDPRW